MLEQHSPSELRIDFMELITPLGVFDLKSNGWVVFNLYEDIFLDNITADVMMNDSMNLPEKLPILGEEYLNFEISSKSLEGEGTSIMPGPLYTTAITKRNLVKDRQQLYMLHLTSEQDVVNSNTTISQSFRGKKISEIADEILNDYIDPTNSGNDFVIEDTVGIENIVIPGWKPFKALNWLAQRAINRNGVPNYLFWESNGTTYFKSIDSIMATEPKQKFIFSPVIDKKQPLTALAEGKTHLSSLKILNQFNTTRNFINGQYASKLITHDIVTKKITQHTFGLGQAYAPDINHTDKYMPISDSITQYDVADRNTFAPQGIGTNEGGNVQSYFDSKVMFHPKHDRMYAKNNTDEYDNNVEDWKLKRRALILGLDQIKLQISFPGISYLRVGYMINIVVPAAERVVEEKSGIPKNPEDLNDKFLSGNYLITKLKHTINWNGGKLQYEMLAEVVKDALGAPPTYGGTK